MLKKVIKLFKSAIMKSFIRHICNIPFNYVGLVSYFSFQIFIKNETSIYIVIKIWIQVSIVYLICILNYLDRLYSF